MDPQYPEGTCSFHALTEASMKSPRRRNWYLAGAGMITALLVGFGARSLWPRPGPPGAEHNAPVPVATARVVRAAVATAC